MARKPRKTPKEEKPAPRKAVRALMPYKVLELAATGGDWYRKVCDELCNGRYPRHPETQKQMGAADLLSWAMAEVHADETIQAMLPIAAQRLGGILMCSPQELFDEKGNLRPVTELPAHVALSIASFDARTTDDGTKISKIKMIDPMQAMRLAFELNDKITQRMELTGKNGGPIQTEDVSDIEIARRMALVIAKGLKQAGTTPEEEQS